jgi:hypothetical protein
MFQVMPTFMSAVFWDINPYSAMGGEGLSKEHAHSIFRAKVSQQARQPTTQKVQDLRFCPPNVGIHQQNYLAAQLGKLPTTPLSELL